MLLALTLAVLGLLVLLWRNGGPLRTMAIAWAVCLVPVAIGAIEYTYLVYSTDRYLWIIALSIAAFLIGAFIASAFKRRPPGGPRLVYDWDADLANWRRASWLCLSLSVVAVLSLLANAFGGGLDLSNLSSLREDTVSAESASVLAKISSVTVWACFFCFAFAIYFRHKLSTFYFALYASPVIGIFLSAYLVAGRTTIFQLILITILVESIRSRRMPLRSGSRGLATKFAVLGSGAAFLIYITLSRTSGVDGFDKADLFLRFFSARLYPGLDSFLVAVSPAFRDFVVEGLIYVSHPIAMFSIFTSIDFGGLYYGVHDFPFVARQLEPIFGHSVIDAYRTKTYYMGTEGVIGVGWITSIHTLILDFGIAGMSLFMALQGYVSQLYWIRVRQGAGFGSVLVCVLLVCAAAFLPYWYLFSDTNMFMLLVFLMMTPALKIVHRITRQSI